MPTIDLCAERTFEAALLLLPSCVCAAILSYAEFEPDLKRSPLPSAQGTRAPSRRAVFSGTNTRIVSRKHKDGKKAATDLLFTSPANLFPPPCSVSFVVYMNRSSSSKNSALSAASMSALSWGGALSCSRRRVGHHAPVFYVLHAKVNTL